MNWNQHFNTSKLSSVSQLSPLIAMWGSNCGFIFYFHIKFKTILTFMLCLPTIYIYLSFFNMIVHVYYSFKLFSFALRLNRNFVTSHVVHRHRKSGMRLCLTAFIFLCLLQRAWKSETRKLTVTQGAWTVIKDTSKKFATVFNKIDCLCCSICSVRCCTMPPYAILYEFIYD